MNVIVAVALISYAVVAKGDPTTNEQMSSKSNNTNTTSDRRNPEASSTMLGSTTADAGRGEKVEKYLFPAMLGFKLTSLVTAIFTALKIFIVQSFVVSKMALLGATILAVKVIYDHMRHKSTHANSWDEHYHYKQVWPDWLPYPYGYADDWSPGFDSHPFPSTDLHSQASEADRTTLPHVHGNTTFSIRSDNLRGRPVPKPVLPPPPPPVAVITRITETTSED